jgi:hypothetical protein
LGLALLVAGCSDRAGHDVSKTPAAATPATLDAQVAAEELASPEPTAKPSPVQAIFAPGYAVKKESQVVVDRRPRWHMATAVKGESYVSVWADADLSSGSVRRLDNARQIFVSGIFDLSKPGVIPRSIANPKRLSVEGMRLPVLAVRIRFEEKDPSTASARKRGPPRRATGVEKKEDLLLLNARTGRRILWTTVRRRSGDGFGGFTLGSMKIEVSGKTITVKTTRQDNLPASRARCLQPKPYPVTFRWDGTQLTKADQTSPARPCR